MGLGEPYDYKPYRRIKIFQINPNNEVPPWDLVKNSVKNPIRMTSRLEKGRHQILLKEAPPKRGNFVNDWQIGEFVWAYLKGTQTKPQYHALTWELEDAGEEAA